MYVKKLILDGFKSYATRTEVTGWDCQFNAITGLNGSGKSNILDAICFVLGITKWDRVRVQNQKQLIYKEGQARVTKASVTIVFDNKDLANSPVGYQDSREITVTRMIGINNKSKYMINGQTAQMNRVRDLFHSVSLDVNNPHFLIMQGMITRVLHHGPKDIKGMIEEAAGTKMYLEKKAQAEKTMKAKESKMQQINTILDEEINPELEKLRKEKHSFIKFKDNQNRIQILERKTIAYTFFRSNQKAEEEEKKTNELLEKCNNAANQLVFLDGEIKKKEEEIETLRKDVESTEGQALKAVQKEKMEIQTVVADLSTKFKNYTEEVDGMAKALEKQVKKIESVRRSLAKRQADLDALDNDQKSFTTQMEETRNSIKQFEGQKLGINTGDDNSGSLEQQLMAKNKELSEARGVLNRCKKEIPGLKKSIAAGESEMKRADSSFLKMKKEQDAKTHQLKMLENERGQLNLDIDAVNQQIDTLAKRKDAVENELENMAERKGHLNQHLRRIHFKAGKDYRRPPGNFDERGVMGSLITLIRVPNKQHHRAIEEILSGNLFAIVVRHSDVAKAIIKYGQTKNRINYFPLNKMRGAHFDHTRLRRAQDIGMEENVYTALSCLEYPPELEPLLLKLLGHILICRDNDIALRVYKDRGVQTTCVSLLGDTFSPNGEVSGGTDQRGELYLSRYEEWKSLHKHFQAKENERVAIENEYRQLSVSKGKFDGTTSRINEVTHRLNHLAERMKNSDFAQKQEEIKAEKAELATLQSQFVEKEAEVKKLSATVKQIKKDIHDFKHNKDKKMKELNKRIRDAKKLLKQYEKKESDEKEKRNKITAMVKSTEKEVESLTKELDTAKAEKAERETEGKVLTEELDKNNKVLAEVVKREEAEKDKLAAQNHKIGELKMKQRSLVNKRKKEKLEEDRTKKQLERQQTTHKAVVDHIERLLAKYHWIHEEKETFNKPGNYDFSNEDMDSKTVELEKLKGEQAALGKRINRRVMAMLERAETEYADLVKRRKTVEADKNKIENVIKELDRKKNTTLKETFDKVNQDFNKIFSDLLHGSGSKLVPKDGDLENGVEIKVSFGNVWKQSLTELSGGQKSLLALSLILALLLYKPAPMYILDEIDAALDPSHTQNIGQMLAQHFKKSQFIVVSLKEGMFNNANVLFRTKFVDGVSTVRKVN